MKVSVFVAGLVWPVLAFGQQMYTNADLARFDVPGAYTNEDLKRLSPLAVQREPAFRLPPFLPPAPGAGSEFQAIYDGLRRTRDALAFEIELEQRRVDFSESAFAGDTRSFEPRLGYRVRAAGLIQELTKRVALLDHEIETLVDDARRAGVTLDRR